MQAPVAVDPELRALMVVMVRALRCLALYLERRYVREPDAGSSELLKTK